MQQVKQIFKIVIEVIVIYNKMLCHVLKNKILLYKNSKIIFNCGN